MNRNLSTAGRRRFLVLLFAVLLTAGLHLNVKAQKDEFHFSRTFNREKPYRIFLPENYDASQKRYPVIYYFHGNTGNHKLDFPGVPGLVDENQVILVAWNGRSEDSDLRPYNIGNHSNINYQVQFKDYFLELVAHIDSSYRTIPDRDHRAVIGHSMGGIMSFFLAGKYPDMIGTAVDSKGSPEFYIGYPENHTLYRVRYMFRNLYGIRLRFTNSTDGELVNLNTEVHQAALREKGLNYEYHVYEGGHRLTAEQFTDAFNFVIASFKDPVPDPIRWNHADIYPDFDLWGYEVRSNLDQPGYIEMHGVTSGGMEISTKKWEPDGVPVPGVTIHVKTPPRYRPGNEYNLLDYNVSLDSMSLTKIKADDMGRLEFVVNHLDHQVGIYSKNSPADLSFVSYMVNDSGKFLDHHKECGLKIRLLNRGGNTARNLTVTLSTTTANVTIKNPVVEFQGIGPAELGWITKEFRVRADNQPVTNGKPFRVRFNISVTDGSGNTWTDDFDAPVYYDVPPFGRIGIDDGDSEMFGSGNGNNIAEPGEYIMVYEISDCSNRTRLYYDDPFVDGERLYAEVQPDKWGDGYTVSSVVHIAADCPPGHKIRFLASYEIKDWLTIDRKVTWGTFTITVGGKEKPEE